MGVRQWSKSQQRSDNQSPKHPHTLAEGPLDVACQDLFIILSLFVSYHDKVDKYPKCLLMQY